MKSPFFLGQAPGSPDRASPQSSSLRRGFFSKRTRWGYPNSWMVYIGKSLLKMKDMDMTYVGYPWYPYYGTIIWWISLWTSYFLIISHIISYPYDKRTSDLGFGKSWFRIGSPMVTTGDPPAMRRNSSHDGDFSKETCDFTNTYGDLAYCCHGEIGWFIMPRSYPRSYIWWFIMPMI